MKKIILFLLLVIFLNAGEEVFEIKKFNYSMENDANVYTDIGYTHGAKISALFYRGNTENSFLNIPFISSKNTNNFISFSYANQMFTPYDLDEIELIADDRPYAGYSYIEIGLHQTTHTFLDSLTLQTGIVGPASGMEELQSSIHNILNSRDSAGWDNQLKNEFILQLNYMHKWRFEYSKIYGFDSVLVPYLGINLGNASVKASGGALYRIGFNIPKDFGVNSMNEGSFSSLPTNSKVIINESSNWSFFLNMAAGSNIIARDIFLDGNTFEDSHSVNKNNFTAYASLGISTRYKNFSLDYLHNYYTKEYEFRGKHKPYRGYGYFVFTYTFK